MKLKLNTEIYGQMHQLLTDTCSLNVSISKEIQALEMQRALLITEYNTHVDSLDLPTIVGEFEMDVRAVMEQSSNFTSLNNMGLIDGYAIEIPLVNNQPDSLGMVVQPDDDEYVHLKGLAAIFNDIIRGQLPPNSAANTVFQSMLGEHNQLLSQLTFSLGLGVYNSDVLQSNHDVGVSEVKLTQTFSIERLGTVYGLVMQYNDHRLQLAYLDQNIDSLKSVSEALANYNEAVIVMPDKDDKNPTAF